MSLPRLLITGASGFLGRRLLDVFKEDYEIFGLARRSQSRSGAPEHPNITWLQADIAEPRQLEAAFEVIRQRGGVEVVVHLAAYYDFTGEDHPEYWRTNVQGLSNVLDACRGLGVRRFVFASSVAACAFPPPGRQLDESSPADGEHTYAITKRRGEELLAAYADHFPATIVRLAALFSDWCEYPPLFIFLKTWLSKAWNRRILGGEGRFAVPYLHVRDAVAFFRRLLDQQETLQGSQVLIASRGDTVPVRDLFQAVVRYYYGRVEEPIKLPRSLCAVGVALRDLLGRLLGHRPFERPWMARYIDRILAVNADATQRLLDWQPRDRLELTRRLPFMLEHLRTDPVEWHRRNQAAMKIHRLATNLRIHYLLERHEEEIREEMTAQLLSEAGRRRFPSYHRLAPDELAWNHTVALRHLLNAVRTNDKAGYLFFCRELAEHRFHQGFAHREVCEVMQTLKETCLRVLREDPEARDLDSALDHFIGMTMLFGCDQVEETFDQLLETRGRRHGDHKRQEAAPEAGEVGVEDVGAGEVEAGEMMGARKR